jgi:hypothetical protein
MLGVDCLVVVSVGPTILGHRADTSEIGKINFSCNMFSGMDTYYFENTTYIYIYRLKVLPGVSC